MWNGVVVEIEASIGRLPDLDLHSLVGGELIIGKGQQLALLFSEDIANQPRPVFYPRTSCGALRCPLECLPIEIG